MKIIIRRLLIFLVFVLGLSACQDSDKIANSGTFNPEDIYFDYRVTAEEGKNMATVILQYRHENEEGSTLPLKDLSKVTFDGVNLRPDSANLTGAFYEVVKPVEEFSGTHTIIFSDSRGKQHIEEFTFIPFTLSTELPEKVQRKPFTINLNGVPERANVRLVMTDTAFDSPDVNEELLINDGEIHIDNGKLQNLQNGPVSLEIFAEEERKLKNTPKAGGRFLLTYGLKRQLELVD